MGKVVAAIGQSRESEKSHSWPVLVEGEVGLDMPPELTSPAGGLGGPAPPVKEWVTRRGSPNPPGSGTTTRSAAEERGGHEGRLPIRGQPCAALLAMHMCCIIRANFTCS